MDRLEKFVTVDHPILCAVAVVVGALAIMRFALPLMFLG